MMITKVLVLMMVMGLSGGVPVDKNISSNTIIGIGVRVDSDLDLDEYHQNRFFFIPFFNIGCGPMKRITLVPGGNTIVKSPRYLLYFSTRTRCQWEISCAPRNTTYLKFDCPTFSLEPSENCVNDRLIVTYKGNRTLYCGDATPDGTITFDGWTRLTFFNSGNRVNKGFNCNIQCTSFAKRIST
ncbi:uncharacterized protein LOC121879279 [Homarus americanus]|uniref:uncharacterized protein LOC121879279 n=1 Tax=Homarus americanus TaxID=6706 RepID=UPI001C46EA6C|nr:uncharacterized protein LOC121879279 [Homarus americanus]